MFVIRAALVLAAVFSIQFAFAADSPKKNAQAAQPPAVQINAKSLELNEAGARALIAKDFAAAENSFRDAVTVDSGNLTAVYNLAGVYLVLKKNDLAKSLLTV